MTRHRALITVIAPLFGLLIAANHSSAAETAIVTDLPAYSREYSATRNPFDDARHAIALAKLQHKNVFIEIGGTWCGWCYKFDSTLKKNSALNQAFYQQFVVLKVSVDDDNDNAEFIKGLPAFTGYPHFFIADSSGDVFLSQTPTDFVADGEFVDQRILNFIDAIAQRPPQADAPQSQATTDE
jgi:thioredoxin-related protein